MQFFSPLQLPAAALYMSPTPYSPATPTLIKSAQTKPKQFMQSDTWLASTWRTEKP